MNRNKEKEKGHLWPVEIGAKLETSASFATATVQNSTLASHGDFIPTHTCQVGSLEPGTEAQSGRHHVSWQEIGEVIKPVSSAGLLCLRQKCWYYLEMTCFHVNMWKRTFICTFSFSDIKNTLDKSRFWFVDAINFGPFFILYISTALLKPFTTDWDLNLCGWDSYPAKSHSTWFQDLVKLRFLMSRGRKNSVRDQAVGKRWLYSDTESTLHTERGHRRGWVRPQSAAWLVFTGWVSSHASEREDCAKCSGEGQRSQDLGLGLLTAPWNCPGASGRAISLAAPGSRSRLVCPLGPVWF